MMWSEGILTVNMRRMLPHTIAALFASAPRQRATTAEKSLRWPSIGSRRLKEFKVLELREDGGSRDLACVRSSSILATPSVTL